MKTILILLCLGNFFYKEGSQVYHTKDCWHVNNTYQEVEIPPEGLRPCKVCNPVFEQPPKEPAEPNKPIYVVTDILLDLSHCTKGWKPYLVGVPLIPESEKIELKNEKGIKGLSPAFYRDGLLSWRVSPIDKGTYTYPNYHNQLSQSQLVSITVKNSAVKLSDILQYWLKRFDYRHIANGQFIPEVDGKRIEWIFRDGKWIPIVINDPNLVSDPNLAE